MKAVFTIIALGSITLGFADPSNQTNGRTINVTTTTENMSGRNSQGQYINSNDYQMNSNQNSTMDQEISKKIHDEVSAGWFTKGFQDVSFDVSHGVVNLRGTIDSLENKQKLEDKIRKIKGVRELNSQLKVEDANSQSNSSTYTEADLQKSEMNYPHDYAATQEDRQLNAKIRAKLSNWFSKGNDVLIIRTSNGIVIVSGSLDKPEDVKKTVDKIKEIEGVRSVNSQLSAKNR